jgi:hypothetical protein
MQTQMAGQHTAESGSRIKGRASPAKRRVSSLHCGPRRDLSASVRQGPHAVPRAVEFGDYGDGRTQRDLLLRNRRNRQEPGNEQAEFSWTVSNIDVGEHCVVIFMSANGTEFHRANGFDQRVYFAYVVRPPLGH